MPKIIYYSRAFTWYLQNPRGTCHVSRNVSQSLLTLRSKKSKNRSYLVWQSIGSSCRPSQLSENICHPSGGIFYIDWGRWGSVYSLMFWGLTLLFRVNHFSSPLTNFCQSLNWMGMMVLHMANLLWQSLGSWVTPFPGLPLTSLSSFVVIRVW